MESAAARDLRRKILDLRERADGLDAAEDVGRGVREKGVGVEEIRPAVEVIDRPGVRVKMAERAGRPCLDGLELVFVELRPLLVKVRRVSGPCGLGGERRERRIRDREAGEEARLIVRRRRVAAARRGKAENGKEKKGEPDGKGIHLQGHPSSAFWEMGSAARVRIRDFSIKKEAPLPVSRKRGVTLATSYSRTTYRRTTIGAAAFHFRVRNGNGWGHCARITRDLANLKGRIVEGQSGANSSQIHQISGDTFLADTWCPVSEKTRFYQRTKPAL